MCQVLPFFGDLIGFSPFKKIHNLVIFTGKLCNHPTQAGFTGMKCALDYCFNFLWNIDKMAYSV
jgi:hypothetical protein